MDKVAGAEIGQKGGGVGIAPTKGAGAVNVDEVVFRGEYDRTAAPYHLVREEAKRKNIGRRLDQRRSVPGIGIAQDLIQSGLGKDRHRNRWGCRLYQRTRHHVDMHIRYMDGCLNVALGYLSLNGLQL